MFLTEQGKIVSKLLDNVNDWGIPSYDSSEGFRTIIHKSGIVLWIAHGRLELEIFHTTEIPYVQIGFFDKFLLWSKVKKVISSLTKEEIKNIKPKNNLENFKSALKNQGFDI